MREEFDDFASFLVVFTENTEAVWSSSSLSRDLFFVLVASVFCSVFDMVLIFDKIKHFVFQFD